MIIVTYAYICISLRSSMRRRTPSSEDLCYHSRTENAPLPHTKSIPTASVRGLSPDNYRRWVALLVSYYALFK